MDTVICRWRMCETEESSDVAGVVQELGLCYKETLGAMNGFVKELKFAKRLWREGNKSRLVKLGLTLIAFPTPVPLDDVAGLILLSAGLIQTKMKNSALYADDICESFPRIINEVNAIRQDLVL